eukprot:3175477-Ditylum_brightwellii.AAC.1
MHAGGAMAFLLGKVDSNTIMFIRHWYSNKMLCYLHTTACQLTQNHVYTMVEHREYQLLLLTNVET